YSATQGDVDAGMDLVNTATVVTTEVPGPTSDDATTTITQTPNIALTKTGVFDDNIIADGYAQPGETITYTLTVENTGNVTLSSVNITDPLPGIVIGALSDNGGNGATVLAPGDIETATATYAITQADINAGVVDNTATATGDCPDGTVDCASDIDSHSEPLFAPPIEEEFCTYTKGFWGNANGKHEGQTTKQILDGFDLANNPVVIGVPGVASITIKSTDCILALLPGGGPSKKLKANQNVMVPMGNSCDVSQSVQVNNNGTIKNGVVTQLIAFILNTRLEPGLLSVTFGDIEDRIGNCFNIPNSIAALGDHTTLAELITYANQVLSGQVNGSLNDLNTLFTDLNEFFDECRPFSCSGDNPGPMAGANLELTKGVDNESPNVGDQVTFSIRVINYGPDQATNVVVEDRLPSGLSYVDDSGNSSTTYNGGIITWNIGTMDNQEEIWLDVIATVNGQGSYTNVAEVIHSDQPDPNSTPDNNVISEDDQDDATVIPATQSGGDCCEDGDKPRRLALRYTAENCSATDHSQSSGSVKCSNSGALQNEVYIVARDDKKGYTWFTGYVTVNSTFIADAAAAGQSKLRPKTLVYIYASEGGQLLQAIEFHTSCSQPLVIGDQFGAIELVGVDHPNGYVCGTIAGLSSIHADASGNDDGSIKILAYPNPASNFVNIELQGIEDDKTTIEVFDALGRLMLTRKVAALDEMPIQLKLPDVINDGMHYVRVKNDREIKTIPIIVRKTIFSTKQ
ncbi:MAG: DUF11 domain-containing protein, partial [Saprospiraceae bacterium]|nr:DUF11 domain-containing protein [Saprospiraceae bacterium]